MIDDAGTKNMAPDASTKLAADRTQLAYDRTLLAWTRTAISLITFGFTIYKFLSRGRPALEATPLPSHSAAENTTESSDAWQTFVNFPN